MVSSSFFRSDHESNFIDCTCEDLMHDNWSHVTVGHSQVTGLMSTALMMPGDYGMELMLGSSPVLTSGFLGSHHTSPFLTDYSRIPALPSLFGSSIQTVNSNTKKSTNNNSNWGFDVGGMPLDPTPGNNNYFGSYRDSTIKRSFKSCRASSRISPPKQVKPKRAEPSKSCLVLRTDLYTEEVGALSPTKEKKKLVFADDHGFPLTEIKIITERPDCPPRWSADFLEQVTGGAKPEAMADTWEVTFSQPAADYLGFKAKLDREFVALENAVVKETENKMTGTIKVRNLSFDKVVRVRYTINDWRTQEEIIAEYVPSRFSTSASYDYHDTFTFDITLPPTHIADKLEFCVCYETDNQQYWDNNSQKNYVIVAFRHKNQSSEPKKTNDAYQMNLDTWSEFASWKHLSLNDSPFW